MYYNDDLYFTQYVATKFSYVKYTQYRVRISRFTNDNSLRRSNSINVINETQLYKKYSRQKYHFNLK